MLGGNWIDLLFVAIVLLSMFRGWRSGLIYGLIDLGAWIGSVVLALHVYQPVAGWLGEIAPWSEAWDRPAAFVLLTLGAGLGLNLIGTALAARLPKHVHAQWVNRLFGILPGLVNGLISAAILATLLLAIPLPTALREASRTSPLVGRLAGLTERAEAALTPIFGDAINQTLTTLTIHPDSDETVQLPFTVAEAQPAPDQEAEMLRLINHERARIGLAPLAADAELTAVARSHSADMLRRGYFAHTSPEGRSPFDRIDTAGIRYRTAGENLALAPTLEMAHTGLMNSPGHRANILRPEFGRVGIGILDAGVHGLMVTQNFRD